MRLDESSRYDFAAVIVGFIVLNNPRRSLVTTRRSASASILDSTLSAPLSRASWPTSAAKSHEASTIRFWWHVRTSMRRLRRLILCVPVANVAYSWGLIVAARYLNPLEKSPSTPNILQYCYSCLFVAAAIISIRERKVPVQSLV